MVNLTIEAAVSTSESPNDVAGEIICIHKGNTIVSIFGANLAENTADEILLCNNLTANYDTYYYNNVQSSGAEASEITPHIRKEGNPAFHWVFQNVLQASVSP